MLAVNSDIANWGMVFGASTDIVSVYLENISLLFAAMCYCTFTFVRARLLLRGHVRTAHLARTVSVWLSRDA